MNRRSWIAATTGVLATLAAPAFAQGYPNKVITLQVPFAPGGTPANPAPATPQGTPPTPPPQTPPGNQP